jgi:hypothetical protein
MKLIRANLWDCQGILFITTNGFVKTDGRAVMGAGVAKQARDLIPGIDRRLGARIRKNGNVVCRIAGPDTTPWFDRHVCSFPVKHNWWEDASLDLIEDSAQTLSDLITFGWQGDGQDVYIPKPGCGNGGLTWSAVEDRIWPILKQHNNVYIVDL